MNIFRQRTIFAAPIKFTNQGSTAGNQWYGSTLATSDTGGYSVVVSTALVADDSIIVPGYPRTRSFVGSNATIPSFAVSCIAPGGFFKLQNVSSAAYVGSLTATWLIVNPRG